MQPTRDVASRPTTDDRRNQPTQQNIARAAWGEYKVTKAVQGAASESMLGAAYPPGAFVAVELGFGIGEGPSLQRTMMQLDAAGTLARRAIRAHTRRKESGDARQRRAAAYARAAGLVLLE